MTDKKKESCWKNYFPPIESWNSCQKYATLNNVFAIKKKVKKREKRTWLGLFFFFWVLFFLFATFEPFMNLSCKIQDLRQLPFADSYKHFIFLQSPGGVRVQFAFQNPSRCLTLTASGFLSVAHPLLSFPLTQFGLHRMRRFWWEEPLQWFACYCCL